MLVVIMMMGFECRKETVWEVSAGGGGVKERVLGGEKGWSMLYTYICEDRIIKPTKYCLKKVGRMEGGYKNIIEEVNLFKVSCMHLWHYHNKTSLNS
jgi:hypothetical protein